MSRKVADVLRAAKKLIHKKDRWCTGIMVNSYGQMCALGALHTANFPTIPIESTDEEKQEGPWDRVSRACGIKELAAAAINYDGFTLVDDEFPIAAVVYRANDSTRNHAKVMQMFDEAIAAAEYSGADCDQV